jgi:DNA polymerase V
MKLKRIKSMPQIDFYTADSSSSLALPFVDEGIAAGFPSPAQDFMDLSLDLNKALIKHPAATFYGRVKGMSMVDAGISDGDILVIDKSLEYRNGMTAVCFLDGEFTVKKLKIENAKVFLIPANDEFEPIEITEENDFIVWGIVTYVIKKV